jgi:hypothetical protein
MGLTRSQSFDFELQSQRYKNALAYSIDGVVVVISKVEGLAPGNKGIGPENVLKAVST